MFETPTPEMTELLVRCGSFEFATAAEAQRHLAKAMALPLQQGVLKGDIVSDIYSAQEFGPAQAIEYPLDFLSPGAEGVHVAYTSPGYGRIPERHVEGDYVMLQTYDTVSSIDTSLKYLKQGRWDIVGRMLQVLEGGFVRKRNTDGWRVILASALGRNLIVYDDEVAPGFLGKRQFELMKTVMRRQAGGNSTSLNRGKLTRLHVSPESLGDVRSWDLTIVDDVTRRDIFLNDEYGLLRVFGVELRDLDELGVGQEFQTYLTTTLGGTLPTPTTGQYATGKQYFGLPKLEWCVGLDLSKDDGAFVHPVRQGLEIYEDVLMHRANRAGFYAREEGGWGNLESRRTLLGAI